MSSRIALERSDAIATLIIHNPEQRNALTPTMLGEIVDRFRELEGDLSIRAVVLRGAGDFFSSGYAIDHIGAGDELPYPDTIDLACLAIERSRLVVTAMLRGVVVGAALEIACACDFRFAEAGTRLGITPAKLGLVYSATGMARIARTVGLPATRELFLTARLVNAEDALGTALVTRVYPSSTELERETTAFAEDISRLAPLSLAGSKRVLFELAQAHPLRTELALELHKLRSAAMDSEDAAEARRAFAGKRPPRFQGR